LRFFQNLELITRQVLFDAAATMARSLSGGIASAAIDLSFVGVR
jgi:hypothetical protein